MKNSPSEQFEQMIRISLKIDSLPGLSSDDEFLRRLQQQINQPPQPAFGFFQVMCRGISNGLAAASIGLILLVGLNTLPPFFLNVTLNGTALVQEKIIEVTVKQQVLWQRLAIRLENLNNH